MHIEKRPKNRSFAFLPPPRTPSLCSSLAKNQATKILLIFVYCLLLLLNACCFSCCSVFACFFSFQIRLSGRRSRWVLWSRDFPCKKENLSFKAPVSGYRRMVCITHFESSVFSFPNTATAYVKTINGNLTNPLVSHGNFSTWVPPARFSFFIWRFTDNITIDDNFVKVCETTFAEPFIYQRGRLTAVYFPCITANSTTYAEA